LTHYTLYRDDGLHSSNYTLVYEGAYVQNYTVTGLIPGREYRFKSSASNAIGCSFNSTEVSWFAASLPSKPSNLTRGALSNRNQI